MILLFIPYFTPDIKKHFALFLFVLFCFVKFKKLNLHKTKEF